MFRWLSWLMSVIGHCLIFSPVIHLLAWIPLVGKLLAAVVLFAVIILALVWATMLHFLILGISWLVYRPLYGLLMLSLVAVGIALLSIK